MTSKWSTLDFCNCMVFYVLVIAKAEQLSSELLPEINLPYYSYQLQLMTTKAVAVDRNYLGMLHPPIMIIKTRDENIKLY